MLPFIAEYHWLNIKTGIEGVSRYQGESLHALGGFSVPVLCSLWREITGASMITENPLEHRPNLI